MKTMTIGELKNKFSSVLEQVAAIIPYEKLRPRKKRSLGLMSDRARCIFKENFTLTDESFLES
jgi:hypothetical protein